MNAKLLQIVDILDLDTLIEENPQQIAHPGITARKDALRKLAIVMPVEFFRHPPNLPIRQIMLPNQTSTPCCPYLMPIHLPSLFLTTNALSLPTSR